MEQELPLRIIVDHPPKGVVFRMQLGLDGLAPPKEVSVERLVFEFSIWMAGDLPNGALNLRGGFVHGPTTGRFAYVSSGALAGQAGSRWTRRAKILLSGITRELAAQLLADPKAVLEARIPGRSKDGGPVCATVQLLDGDWRIAAKELDAALSPSPRVPLSPVPE